jgi:hypothetical protein
VLEDLSFELSQLRAWLYAELAREVSPRFAVGGERIGLPSPAIESKHQLCSESFAQRLGRHELLGVVHELLVTAEFEHGVGAQLRGIEA